MLMAVNVVNRENVAFEVCDGSGQLILFYLKTTQLLKVKVTYPSDQRTEFYRSCQDNTLNFQI